METNSKIAQYRRTGNSGMLKLSGIVDIFEAETILALAKKSISDEKTNTIQIDLEHIEKIDISAIQILCTLKHECEKSGKVHKFVWGANKLCSGVESLGIFLTNRG